jgi:gluconolactonase
VREAEEIPRTSPVTLDAQDKSFHLFEGPVWWRSALYFSDFETTPGFPSRILRYTPGLSLAVEVEDAGTNGLALEPGLEGLLGASHKTKSVVRFSEDLKAVEPLAQSFAGKPFNSPNDLTMRSDGHVYFTDPDFQAGDSETQGSTNVYWVTPKGVVSAVETTIKNPNGIAISPDERFLLVSGNLEAGFVKRYPLAEDGSVGRGTIIVESVSVPDGMTFDCAGHLYVTEHVKRRVRVFDLSGRELGEIRGLSKNVTNVAFGGSEGKTLFITMTGGLASIELPVPGLPY